MQVPVILVEMGIAVDQLVVGSLVTTVSILTIKVFVFIGVLGFCFFRVTRTGRPEYKLNEEMRDCH